MNFPADPAAPAHAAPAIWRRDGCAFIITLTAPPGRWAEVVEGMAHGSVVCDTTGPAGRHLVLDRGGSRHRLLLTPGEEGAAPTYLLPAEGPLALRTAALTVFHFPADNPASRAQARALQPTPFQHYRLRLMLEVLDARNNGDASPASLRLVAATVFGGDLQGDRAIEWKTSSRRRQIQRLLAEGLHLVEGGYRDLLNGCLPANGAARD
ncbi:DUF2285 domain-containing protein [Erythrobacter sp. NE805]|uniref:DUF2285 domain-containing protein n=1 Tax=Erythrobacter sp. NE805 TaxID=3389875 RepID=UPI00396B3E73